jgi:hypothetical protein
MAGETDKSEHSSERAEHEHSIEHNGLGESLENRGHEGKTGSPGATAEMTELGTAQTQFCYFSVTLNSLLRQFSSLSIRADFINGLFGSLINPNLLGSIDELKCLVSPWWTGGLLLTPNIRRYEASVHINKILQKHDSIFKLPSDNSDPLTYKEWFYILELIATSKYWTDMKKEDNCIHRDSSYSGDVEVGGENVVLGEVENDDVKKKVVKKEKVVEHGRKKIEEIVILSSEEETSSSSEQTVSCSSDSSSAFRKIRRRRGSRQKKEVVIPPIFNMNGKSSLSSFFKAFEQYFNQKYSGTEYDQSQLLGNFLQGKLLEVYTIKGGRRLKYKTMKQDLQTWYTKQKVGSRSYWRSQFETACIGDSEAIDIFGLRLTELAELAYPSSKSEGARQLRQQFLKNMNSIVVEKLKDMEHTMYAANRKQKRMSFNNLVEMACKVAKDRKSEVVVNWTHPKSEYQHRNSYHTEPVPTLTFASNAEKHCFYCKRKGHLRKDCWRASKSCLICGKDHHMEKCSRYQPNFRKNSIKNPHLN